MGKGVKPCSLIANKQALALLHSAALEVVLSERQEIKDSPEADELPIINPIKNKIKQLIKPVRFFATLWTAQLR